MPSFASDPPSLSSRRPPLGRLYRSCHRTERSVKSRRARCALMVLDVLFGIRPPPSLSSRRPHRTFVYRSCHRVQSNLVQVETRSLCAHGSRCPLWRRTATPSLCSRRPHWTFVYRSRHRARRPSSRDALDVLTVLDALFCVGPAVAELSPSTSLGRLYRSCHRTERLFKSRCTHRVLMVLDALFGVGPPPPRCTRPSTSDVFTALAIVQGDGSSRDALLLRSRCPSLASGRRRCCALAVHIGRLYRSRHHARRSFKSRRARCAHGSRCPLWRRTAAAAVLLPSP
jgi:hypothetical protein